MNFSIYHGLFCKKTNLKQGAHIHHSTAWLVTHAWPVSHPGSGSMDSSFALVSTQIKEIPDPLSLRMPWENYRAVPS